MPRRMGIRAGNRLGNQMGEAFGAGNGKPRKRREGRWNLVEMSLDSRSGIAYTEVQANEGRSVFGASFPAHILL